MFYISLLYIVLSKVTCVVYASLYSVALLGLELRNENLTSTARYEFILINPGIVDIVVTVTNVTHTVKTIDIAGLDEANFGLDAPYSLNGLEYANKTLFVWSDNNFTLQVISHFANHAEGYIGIPLEDLLGPHAVRTVYEYVVTTFCATSGFCQLAITTFRSAIVKLEFPANAPHVVFCIGKSYFRAIRDNVLDMKQFEAVQIESSRDLTGTHIFSNSPIAVYVGSRNLSVNGTTSHTLEQLPTTSQWGTEFGVKAVGESEYGDILKISSGYLENTTVKMTGFSSFLLPPYQVVTRRLEKETASIIKSTNPIQVVQITGNGYYTDGSVPHMGLTIVPSMEHRTNYIRLSCGEDLDMGKFVVFTENSSPVPQLDAIEMSVFDQFIYKDYIGYSRTGRGLKLYTVEGDNIAGMVHCLNGPVFPLGLKHTVSLKKDATVPLEDLTSETCIEGEVVEYTCDVNGKSLQLIEERNFEEFSALKLRVKACGTTLLQLKLDENNTVVIQMHIATNAISICQNGVCNDTIYSDDTFNANRNCRTQMAWYWIKQSTSMLNILSFGTGPISIDSTGQSILLESQVRSFSLMGVYTNATFFYDLEHEHGCTTRVSGWRCEDRFQNCTLYGKDFCNTSEHAAFAAEVCPKYCGRCYIDHFGRRFVGVLHNLTAENSQQGYVYVTTKSQIRNIAMATKKGPINAEYDISQEKVRFEFANLGGSSQMFWIVSDTDVAVTVVLYNSVSKTSVSYNVYPSDTFDKEYITMTYGGNIVCDLLTESSHKVLVKPFLKDDLTAVVYYGPAEEVLDTSEVRLEADTLTRIRVKNGSKLDPEIILKSDKPFAVFCGGQEDNGYYNQLFPAYLLGTHFRIPSFEGYDKLSFLSEGKLVIQPLEPDTIVEMSGDYDITHIFPNPDSKIELRVNLQTTYELRSNNAISVGLFLSVTQETSSFLLMPPTTQFIQEAENAILTETGTMGCFVSSNGVNVNMFISGEGDMHISTANDYGEDITELFGVMVRNMPEWDAFIFVPTFSSLTPAEPPDVCEISKPIANDSLDNDCDGLVDENVCCREDSDLDGDYTDDFSERITEPDRTPDEPLCIPINRPGHQCWTVCQCPCHWVESLMASRKLSREEFMRIQMIKALAIQERLKLDTANLTKTTIQKISADDRRQSAANMGYVGVTLLVLSASFIVFLDVSSIKRDLVIWFSNLKDGVQRCYRCFL